MALHVPMPIFGDHEIRLACRLRFGNKESPLHHQMCRTPTFLLSPFGTTPWSYPLELPLLNLFLWGVLRWPFQFIFQYFSSGSNVTIVHDMDVRRAYHGMWLWVSRHNYCISLTYDFISARKSKAKVHHGEFDHEDTARGCFSWLRRAQKTSGHLAGLAIQH